MKKIVTILMAAAFVLSSVSAFGAEPKPRWMQKRGVKVLNKQRSNDSYAFHIVRTVSDNEARLLNDDGVASLTRYVGEQYNVKPESIVVSRLVGDNAADAYLLSFSDGEGHGEVCAQQVDEHIGYANDVTVWNLAKSRLYAISERNAVPQFDEFSLSNKYGAKPVFMSIIPGLGQIYKGQQAKGYTIMGAEAVFIGGTIFSAVEMAKYRRFAKDNPGVASSYESNVTTFRQLRNTCLIAGGALYLYNLIDAAVAKGARRVTVKRPNNTDAELAFAPVITEFGGGVGLSVRF